MLKSMILILLLVSVAAAQVSNGTDGALNIPPNLGVVVFDPVALNLDTDGDNVFHFTTISIGQSSTLKLKASKFRKNTAVVFLASGNIILSGGAAIDLSGEDGVMPDFPVQISRRPAEPGPGGFAGGLGQRSDTTPITAASDGFGPAGSRGVANTSGCAVTDPMQAKAAHLNLSTIPLVGGAGGAGLACISQGGVGGNGGAGGGALRLVSSTQIQLGQGSQILALGGLASNGYSSNPANGRYGESAGKGGGGIIHLVAPQVSFDANVQLRATPGNNVAILTPLASGAGVIRINANTLQGSPGISFPSYISGPFYTLPVPAGIPEVSITQVNNTTVTAPPSGLVTGADVVINSAGASTISISAKFIPVGTLVNLRINSDVVADQSVTCSPLAGVLANSTATCTATIPLGANITIASASW